MKGFSELLKNLRWTIKYNYFLLSARIRHGKQCETCDRRIVCKIIKRGSRPCDWP